MRRAGRIISSGAALLVGLSGGCARLTAGDLRSIDRSPPHGRVVVVRGFLDWYSDGMDRLTAELRATGVEATAFREEQWGEVAGALAERDAGEPLVLVGFSYGADDVVSIARRLADRGRRVDLLVTIDPVTPDRVPANVHRCVNFYEPNGVWDVLPWLRGVPLSPDGGQIGVENIDVRARPDLAEPGTSHATIAANESVHRAIVTLARQACGSNPANATRGGR